MIDYKDKSKFEIELLEFMASNQLRKIHIGRIHYDKLFHMIRFMGKECNLDISNATLDEIKDHKDKRFICDLTKFPHEDSWMKHRIKLKVTVVDPVEIGEINEDSIPRYIPTKNDVNILEGKK